jgi:capsule polysaccharide export protein KpsE/RkpR
VQLVKPKKFSFIWALVWFLLFGIGLIVYLLYYGASATRRFTSRSTMAE